MAHSPLNFELERLVPFHSYGFVLLRGVDEWHLFPPFDDKSHQDRKTLLPLLGHECIVQVCNVHSLSVVDD